MAFIISTTIMNTELKERLMLLAERYETPAFIVEDPIRIPHRYHSQTDVEISALVTSWIATGNRKAIIRSADRIDCAIFKNAPYQYIMSKEWRMYAGQKGSFYRYYSFDDFYLLCDTLYTVYSRKPTLEDYLYESFETLSPLQRLQSVFGHINGMPEMSSTSEAKKMCMFLRWMIRRDSCVDFGLWQRFHPRELIVPLDTHVHRIAMDLGLTQKRKCIRTACDITNILAQIWPDDPVKGDFALFGFGINEAVK